MQLATLRILHELKDKISHIHTDEDGVHYFVAKDELWWKREYPDHVAMTMADVVVFGTEADVTRENIIHEKVHVAQCRAYGGENVFRPIYSFMSSLAEQLTGDRKNNPFEKMADRIQKQYA